MFFEDIIWLPNIIDKLIVKHRVLPEEAEEIFFNNPIFRFVESGYRIGEDVYSARGRTDAGRYIIVFFIHKSDNTILILSARDMNRAERRRYEHGR